MQPLSPIPWVAALLAWYSKHRRALPWRNQPTPYRVWISEVMLQQTQVPTAIPYFRRFLKRFPSLPSLATSPLEEVLRLWEGLGYYARARNLHRTAQIIAHDRKGRWPRTFMEWQMLPGIGRYTAAAIASIAFGESVPVVDGNVLRLLSRLWGVRKNIRNPRVQSDFFRKLQSPVASASDPGSFNQAMMELGARICTPRNPHCAECPLNSECKAYRAGTVARLPVGRRPTPKRRETVGVGIVFDRHGHILIARRPANRLLGGLWEFPGGRRQGEEPLEETVRREVREETGVEVAVEKPLPVVRHAYSHFAVELHPFLCRHIRGTPHPLAADEVRWVHANELRHYPFPAANRKIEKSLFAPKNHFSIGNDPRPRRF